MLIAGEDSIREVIAFPKNNKGADLMSHSPCQIDRNRSLLNNSSSYCQPYPTRRVGAPE